MYVPKQMIVE